MLPPRLVSRLHLSRPRLLVTVGETGCDVELESLEGRRHLGRSAWGDQLPPEVARAATEADVIMVLPADEVLVTDIALPAAAQENLKGVVGYEMDRHTPFTAAQVHYGCRRLGGPTASGGIPVRLAVVPRERMDALVQRLATAGLSPASMHPAGEPRIDLTPSATSDSTAWRPSVRGMLAATACILLVAAVGFPLWELDRAARTLREEAADLAEPAQRAQSLRETRDRLLAQAQSVADMRANQPSVLAALEELARLLPDDTWIWALQLHGDELVIRGKAPSASGLIERIEQSPLFEGVGFNAPITREDGGERFQIAMRLMEGQA
ncbi:type II secretion system protein GspL [Arhodomonas sp. AD133]|uniref:PilN domain-containing protein n=1 Tax=Arhodomonas sp. AD133 TaxID=3415009 RepID=UPI003EB9580C